jgi:xanthine dehydrogenase accessory factor
MNTPQPVDIHRRIVEFIDAGRSFAVGVVLAADGSTPRKIGAKAIIEADGRIWATLGGGQVEAMAQQRAIEACKSKKVIVFDMAFEGASATSDQPICGGAMRILIDPNAKTKRAAYASAARAVSNRQRGVLLTRICCDGEIAVDNEWFTEEQVLSAKAEIAKDMRKCMEKERARLVEGDSSCEVLIEPVISKPVLLIAGGGHVGQAVAAQAIVVGFDVIVLDDRREFTAPDLFVEGIATRCGDVADGIGEFDISGDTYIVIVTRGHRHDVDALRACIHSPAGYIGMIGSERKVDMIRRQFIESNIATAEEFDRVYARIGVDIGALTVPEIATSIVAQLVAVRRRGADYEARDMVQR